MASPMPSLRHEAAAFRPLSSICAATLSAFSSADSRLSMANTALSADAAHAVCRWLTLESTLRMKWTMHRWYLASGSIALTVETSPAHRSPTTSRTPLRPRSIMLLTNCPGWPCPPSCPQRPRRPHGGRCRPRRWRPARSRS